MTTHSTAQPVDTLVPPIVDAPAESPPVVDNEESTIVDKVDPLGPVREGGVTVDLPDLSDVTVIGHCPSTIELRLFGRDRLRTFVKRMALALEEQQAKLSDGTVVKGNAKAMLWMLERLESAV